MEARKLIPVGSKNGEQWQPLKRRLRKSLHKDHGQWLVAKVMKADALIGDTIKLFRLIKETSIKKSAFNETVSEYDDSIIHS